MLIEDTEALRNWLIIILEPLCDADSSALARYVLALLKKDKQEKDLKRVMVEQLDVFLSEQTKPFVERLFEAISTEEYLKPLEDGNAHKQDNSSVEPAKKKTVIKSENQESICTDLKQTNWSPRKIEIHKESFVGDLNEGNKKDVYRATEIKSLENEPHFESSTFLNAVKVDPDINPADHVEIYKDSSVSPQIPRTAADKENQPRELRRRFIPQRSRSRSWSRDRSADRCIRRSRSKDRRTTDREKNVRQFKNKSPNNESRQLNPYERRRSGGERRRAAVVTDERSPRFGNGSGDGGRKGIMRARSQSRSRSPSSEKSANFPKASGKDISPGKASRSPLDPHNIASIDTTEMRQRCRDFDEKGYCVRGETCPWDHGVNPVVFEGVNNPSLLTMSLREYNPDAPDLWSRTGPGIPLSSAVTNPLVVGGPSINPFSGAIRPVGGIMTSVGGPTSNGNLPLSAADYSRASVGSGFRPGGSLLSFSFNPGTMQAPLQRELIPIPVIDVNSNTGNCSAEMNHSKRRYDIIDDNLSSVDGPTKRKIPINSRLGPRITTAQGNCSLELRKVPRGLNTIAHLNNHFAKFGKIINIQISYDGDPEAAIVTFSNHAEANVAYRSTEAVLNNRFIKVFWHNQDLSVAGEMPLISAVRKSQYHVNNVVTNQNAATDSSNTSKLSKPSDPDSANENNTAQTSSSPEKTIGNSTHITPNSVRHKTPTSRTLPNTSVLRKKQEQAKAVVQLANGLRKRKQELLQSYLKQMKSALELVERVEPNDPQRAKTVETIKILQESIDKLRKEIATEQEHLQAQIHQLAPAPKKTKEQAKKELLDIELELFAQQQEGNDTSAIQKRLEELQRSLGIGPNNAGTTLGQKGLMLPSKNLNFTRGSRGRFSDVSTRVDRRPKSIIVTGFTKDEVEVVLAHLKGFGEVLKHEIDANIPQLTIHYTTRLNAEQAMVRGKVFKEKCLQILWPAGPSNFSLSSTTTNNTKSIMDSASNRADDATSSLDLESSFSKEGESSNNDTLPELPLEDEEDDDESEDRSWRR